MLPESAEEIAALPNGTRQFLWHIQHEQEHAQNQLALLQEMQQELQYSLAEGYDERLALHLEGLGFLVQKWVEQQENLIEMREKMGKDVPLDRWVHYRQLERSNRLYWYASWRDDEGHQPSVFVGKALFYLPFKKK